MAILSGCAHGQGMKEKAFAIQEGSSASDVTESLGQPDEFGQSQIVQGAEAWYYKSGPYVCGFTISNNVVVHRACATDSSYRSPAAKAAMALGQAFQGAGHATQNYQGGTIQTPVNCTTSTYGNQSYTNCY